MKAGLIVKVTYLLIAALALPAMPASPAKRGCYPVADFDILDIFTNFSNSTGQLVAGNMR